MAMGSFLHLDETWNWNAGLRWAMLWVRHSIVCNRLTIMDMKRQKCSQSLLIQQPNNCVTFERGSDINKAHRASDVSGLPRAGNDDPHHIHAAWQIPPVRLWSPDLLPFPISPFYSLSSVRLSSFSHLKHADTWKGPRLSSERKFSCSQEKPSCQLFRKHRGRDGAGKKKRRRRGARRGTGGFEDGEDGRIRGDEAQTGGEEAENILRTLRLRSEELQRGKRACVRSPCVSIHVESS